ncbi:hypothetical protein KFL_000740030 [Klebsormidium nitens]|uniref:Uncharacterized protein n=1 Tax=Klebsormidium nitens TaxID=105231 RepID=A0A1Y1HTN5_KLENI|nr:hypothetical protein KFL_000740030 [Klebsormidium nitens]|eukprot:GAQ81202.1 hypothetical protein KFL_000740030 [Klebsormidium nitens]
MAAPLFCSFVLMLVFILAGARAASASCGASEKILEGTVRTDNAGVQTEPLMDSFILPEPALVNDFLRNHSTFKNPLLPSSPPLQLIKCEVYLALLGREGLFNFYAAEHSGGCRVPPPVLPLPESSYSAYGKFWFVQLRRSLTSWRVLLIIAATHGVIHLLSYPYYDTVGSSGKKSRNGENGTQSRQAKRLNDDDKQAILIASILFGLLLAFVVWIQALVPQPLQLPDPSISINPFLHVSSNTSLSLHRCTVPWPGISSEHFLFDFYIGLPSTMCDRILATQVIYPDYVTKGPPNLVGTHILVCSKSVVH